MSRVLVAGFGLVVVIASIAWLVLGSGAPPDAGGSGGAERGGVEQGRPAPGGSARGEAGPARAAGGESGSSGRPGGAQGRPGGSGRPGGGRGSRETLVVTRPAESGVTGDRLMALGDGEAAASVTVVPEGTGLLRRVDVASGQRVAAGEVLAALDAEAESIARDIALRAVSDAEATRDRRAELIRSQAGSQVDLDAAETGLARAQLDLREAELALARRSVIAPIDGVVGLVDVEAGDRITPDTAIATIDDRTRIRVDFRVPERFAAEVEVGQSIRATSFALPGLALDGAISAVGSRVEADSRTLPVQALFDNADDRLRPGMSFSLSLAFDGETLPAVDPLAVRWDAEGAHVWRVVDGKAERVAARIVQRDSDAVLLDAALAPGDAIIVEGLLSLRDGAAVRVDAPRPPDGEGARRKGDASERGGDADESGT